MLDVGTLIGGRYRLVRQIGEGGMGAVWAARNETIDRDVAIKVMLPWLAKQPQLLQRFFNEARICGSIRDPGIVDVLDLGSAEDGSPFIVMELLNGESLEGHLTRERRLPPVAILPIVRDVAATLALAHEKGIVHRDLKPANLFLHQPRRGQPVAKILDFGISKVIAGASATATLTGSVLGSPAYMSPEQAAGKPVDLRTDIYALGVILYEALSGRRPFEEDNPNALIIAIVTTSPPPLQQFAPDVPAPVAELVASCMARDREHRPPTANALADRIDTILVDFAPPRAMSVSQPALEWNPSRQSAPMIPAPGAHLPPGTYPHDLFDRPTDTEPGTVPLRAREPVVALPNGQPPAPRDLFDRPTDTEPGTVPLKAREPVVAPPNGQRQPPALHDLFADTEPGMLPLTVRQPAVAPAPLNGQPPALHLPSAPAAGQPRLSAPAPAVALTGAPTSETLSGQHNPRRVPLPVLAASTGTLLLGAIIAFAFAVGGFREADSPGVERAAAAPTPSPVQTVVVVPAETAPAVEESAPASGASSRPAPDESPRNAQQAATSPPPSPLRAATGAFTTKRKPIAAPADTATTTKTVRPKASGRAWQFD